jgi:hypothetical protein
MLAFSGLHVAGQVAVTVRLQLIVMATVRL